MTFGELIFILIINFIVLILIVLFLIRHLSDRIKDKFEESSNKFSLIDNKLKNIDDKFSENECRLMRVESRNIYPIHNRDTIPNKDNVHRSLEKMKSAIKDIDEELLELK
jgi:hypothetical protein